MNDAHIYEELYHFDDKHFLVLNRISGDVFMCKILTHYDPEVYRYLADNPDRHVPRIESVSEENGTLRVIEEYVRGSTFETVMIDPALSDRDKLSYFVDLCEGLKFLHSAPRPIIHRDLKPSNIMVCDDGHVVIIDYDAAKTFKPQQSQDTTCLGTEGRAAPEQYGFMQSDARTDIYAVGRMLNDAFPDNTRIRKIAAKAMSFDPADRYDSVDTLLNALTRKIGYKAKLKPLFPPPGFRSRTWWKMPLAIMGYPFLIYIAVSMTIENGSQAELIISKIFLVLYALTVIDICCSWTGIYDVFPFINDDRWYLRWFFRIVYSFAALIVMTVVFLFTTGIVRHLYSLFGL
ncbi:Protein kinase domain-containing protein [Ruminococcaceae bacterium YRB3002]|nr:Protein kinase domain-containing protein [Ruminococcaceae bacterium YRB3002]